MWRKFTKAFREFQRTFPEAGRSYRPDLHYMRGPGPKWHAKYGNLAPQPMRAAPAQPMRQTAEHPA